MERYEKALAGVLITKITITLVFWSGPLILFPATVLEWLGLDSVGARLLARLLGWAYLSLVVGYGFGLNAVRRGQSAAASIWMGIVSNGGACGILLLSGFGEGWMGGPPALSTFGWASVAATALITAGLLYFGVILPARTGEEHCSAN